METTRNPFLFDDAEPTVDLDSIESPTVLAMKRRAARRELRDHRRTQEARAAVAGFDRETALYGFTKGQFSLIQLLDAVLDVTGPCDLFLSTWTAANQDVSTALAFCEAGRIRRARWLVDLSFSKRSPQLAQRIRETWGPDAIRVAQNHAKFALLSNDDGWRVVVRTSMNLNHNPRFENFELAHDPALFAFHEKIADEIFAKQDRRLAEKKPGEIARHFAAEM